MIVVGFTLRKNFRRNGIKQKNGAERKRGKK
jgi:hypothetical protein